jgi:ParB family chromosome partitioning protein
MRVMEIPPFPPTTALRHRSLKMSVIKEVDVSLLAAPGWARSISDARVADLVKSISEIGLQNPIIVRADSGSRADGQGLCVIAGGHRVEAFKRLNRRYIPAIVREVDDLRAELISIDENLCREGLTSGQEAVAVARRKEIYEALHPETVHGGDRKSSRQNGDLNWEGHDRFTKATAAATRKSERTIQRASRRGEKIGSQNLERLVGTSLDRAGQLDALAVLPAAEQDPSGAGTLRT